MKFWEKFTMKNMCVNEKSYEVIKLLGHGKGGYSFLVTDGTKEYVIKQIHHEPCDYYQFGNKMESLWCRKINYIILITSVTIIWRNGILKIGGSNIGLKQKSFWNM